MKRDLTSLRPRIIVATLVVAIGMIVFSYAHARTARRDDPAAGGEGKCGSVKCQSPFVLWESLTHNLLISKL